MDITIKNFLKVGVMAVAFILLLRVVAKNVPQLQGIAGNV